jgi:hypothetical protein
MSFRDKAQIVVVSVVIALALAAGSYYFVAGPSLGPGGIRGGTDDQPIIMAGGSLYIGTGETAKFKAVGDTLDYTEGYKVFRVDVVDMSENGETWPVGAAGSGQIDIEYCRLDNTTGQCSSQTDKVTMTFYNNVSPQVISIKNSLTGKPISKARRMMPTLRTHPRKRWTMFKVRVKVEGTVDKGYECGPDSECEVVVHTCTSGTNCVAS